VSVERVDVMKKKRLGCARGDRATKFLGAVVGENQVKEMLADKVLPLEQVGLFSGAFAPDPADDAGCDADVTNQFPRGVRDGREPGLGVVFDDFAEIVEDDTGVKKGRANIGIVASDSLANPEHRGGVGKKPTPTIVMVFEGSRRTNVTFLILGVVKNGQNNSFQGRDFERLGCGIDFVPIGIHHLALVFTTGEERRLLRGVHAAKMGPTGIETVIVLLEPGLDEVEAATKVVFEFTERLGVRPRRNCGAVRGITEGDCKIRLAGCGFLASNPRDLNGDFSFGFARNPCDFNKCHKIKIRA